MSYRYKIIDASAGTGKTFSLRKNILIKLLSADDFSFKQILAVTFTNNASNEMKQSILSDLYVISNNPKNSKVLTEINKEVEIPNDFVSKVIDSLDKKVKTTTNKGTKIILLSLIGLISLLILVFGIKSSSKETDDIE